MSINIIKFRVKDLANYEGISTRQAYRKFNKIKLQFNLPFVRRFLTATEVQTYYVLSDKDFEELKTKLKL